MAREGMPRELGQTAGTLVLGCLGALAFWAVGFPAPFLTGPATLVTLASLLGVPTRIGPRLRDICFFVIGISIGASVTPEVVRTAITWPLSLLVLAAALYAMMWLCRRMLERGFGFDPLTALLAATPGHLSYVLGLTVDMKADLSRVAIVQSIRVLLLTLLVPVILTLWSGPVTAVPAVPHSMELWAMFGTACLAVICGLLLKWLNVPAAFLLGGMLVSAIGHATDWMPGSVPVELTIAAFVTMGALIGTRFRGVSMSELRRGIWAGCMVTLLACAVAAMAAGGAAYLLDLPPAMLLIAFAPGGVEIMAAMAVQIGVEPAFVAAHHVLRLLILTVLVPVLLRNLRRDVSHEN